MKKLILVILLALGIGLTWGTALVSAQEPYPITATDQTPTQPLTNPTPSAFQPRYISGFGLDDAFTVFFEDRDNDGQISYNQTTTGPLGFASTSTATNIADTHFLVKDWPITVSSTVYAYRGWGAVGNNPQHHFYVSNNLITWTLVSTFTIANTSSFTTARGFVYYGFHDVIELNGVYYAFGEANSGQTMIVSSTTGAGDWVAFDSIGGTQAADGPLQMPESGTPSGSFVQLEGDRGYGKIHVRGDDSGFYLAINTAAKPSLSPVSLEAAFIDPANWTWNDGSTGLPTTPIISATTEHDLRECWGVPQSDPDADWTIIYDADFGSGDGGKALGYIDVVPSRPVHHFTFASVGDQVETVPFTITMAAEDAYGHTVVSYTAPVTLTDSAGAISPTLSGAFAGGVLTQTVAITIAQTDVVITATHTTTPTITGYSAPFDVLSLPVTNLDTGERFLTIQTAIDDTDTVAGHTISVTAGVYIENVTVNKRVSIIGAGSGDDAASNTIIRKSANTRIVNLAASGFSTATILLQDLRIEPDGVYGIEVPDGESVSYVKLDNVKVVGADTHAIESEIGLKVAISANLSHFTVANSAFDNCDIGWYFAKHGDWGPGGSNVTYITVTHTTFNDNDYKGIYVEKLSDAAFESCTVDNNGHSDFWNQVWNGGFDINLKGEEIYQNLTFRDMTVTNNGLGYKEGAGFMIKGRDDGTTYGAHPATLITVTIEGGVFTGNERGIRFGEPGQNNATPTNVQIHNTVITGNVQVYTDTGGSEYGGLVNHTQSQVDATLNDWGVTGLPAIEDKIYHHADSSLVGEALYYDIMLDDDGGSPMADGASYATVTGALTGLLYPAGNVISFTTDLGALSAITGTADANGIVTTTITSLVTGTATITGTTGMGGENPRSGATQVAFIAPLPIITSLSPVSATVGGAGFTLTVNGANFVSGSVVYWNGAVRATTFVSGAQLIAEIPASDLETVGVAVVTVVNPAPDGGVSNGLPFEVIEFVQEKPVFIYLPLVCKNATPYSHRLYLPLVSRSAAP